MAAAEREEKRGQEAANVAGLAVVEERAEQVRKRKAELAEQRKTAEGGGGGGRREAGPRAVRSIGRAVHRAHAIIEKAKAALLVTPLPKRKYTKHKQKRRSSASTTTGSLERFARRRYTGSDKGREAAAARKRRQREREKNAKTTTKKAIKRNDALRIFCTGKLSSFEVSLHLPTF